MVQGAKPCSFQIDVAPLWCFQGRGTIESIDTLFNLSWACGKIGSGSVLEPIFKSVLELVLKSVREGLS